MIASLRGRAAGRSKDWLTVDVGGVGYRVFMSQMALDRIVDGGEVHVHVHTHVREDAIHLFGFLTETDREIFLALNTVTGIGPKVALGILSGATTEELVGAVASGDVKRLTHLPGVGKKTAERILVELREVFKRILPDVKVPAHVPSGSRTVVDVASALANLGFKPAHIERALAALEAEPDPPTDFDALLREALKHLR